MATVYRKLQAEAVKRGLSAKGNTEELRRLIENDKKGKMKMTSKKASAKKKQSPPKKEGCSGWLVYTTEEGIEFVFDRHIRAFHLLRAALEYGARWYVGQFEHEDESERQELHESILEPFADELRDNETDEDLIEGGRDEVYFFLKRLKFDD